MAAVLRPPARAMAEAERVLRETSVVTPCARFDLSRPSVMPDCLAEHGATGMSSNQDFSTRPSLTCIPAGHQVLVKAHQDGRTSDEVWCHDS